MSCLGVHFALTEEEVSKLCSFNDEQARLNHLKEVIEEVYFEKYENYLAESDKSWDAMHRALADGELTWDGGKYPLNHTVLGGEILYTQTDYIMSLKTPSQVIEVSKSLQNLDETQFKKLYNKINPKTYSVDLSQEDLDYTWEWFKNVRTLFQHASKDNRYVLFTADQ